MVPRQLIDLQGALQAGLGWTEAEWRVVCTSLFASSDRERRIVQSTLTDLMRLTHLHDLPLETEPPWDSQTETPVEAHEPSGKQGAKEQTNTTSPSTNDALPPVEPNRPRPRETTLEEFQETGAVPMPEGNAAYSFTLAPQFPVQERVARQLGRYLRLPVRSTTDWRVDIDATINAICQTGIVHPPVFVRPLQRLSRLVLLEDRGGSMVPFHAFSDAVGAQLAPRLHAYFYDLPASPLYADRELYQELALDDRAKDAPLLIISDAGAGRRGRDPRRAALTKLYLEQLPTRRIAWLNPLPCPRWERTTAALIAELVPMFPLDNEGLLAAIAQLRREK